MSTLEHVVASTFTSTWIVARGTLFVGSFDVPRSTPQRHDRPVPRATWHEPRERACERSRFYVPRESQNQGSCECVFVCACVWLLGRRKCSGDRGRPVPYVSSQPSSLNPSVPAIPQASSLDSDCDTDCDPDTDIDTVPAPRQPFTPSSPSFEDEVLEANDIRRL
jgi:hypothetical protein